MRFNRGSKLSMIDDVARDFMATMSRTEKAALETMAASMNLTRDEVSLIFTYEKTKADVLDQQFEWKQLRLQEKWDKEHVKTNS